MSQAQVRVIAQTDNVAGVRIPKFQQHNMSGESKMNLTGLGKGGQQVQQCRKVSKLITALRNRCIILGINAKQLMMAQRFSYHICVLQVQVLVTMMTDLLVCRHI